jgi:uncharacterized protein YndB with AHSA1/START domain
MTVAARIAPAAVKKSITVNAPPERAFEVFTAEMGAWWPASHSVGTSPQKAVVIEPKVGGRWYEVGENGSECAWGDVLDWEKPKRVVLAWRIGLDWRYDPTLLTEVEVVFTPIAGGKTRIELEHRRLENMGDNTAATIEVFEAPNAWSGLLDMFAEKAK